MPLFSLAAIRRKTGFRFVIHATLAACAVFLFILQFNSALLILRKASGADFFPNPWQSTSTGEELAVLEWLKNNTPPDAVVLAAREEGHRIVAFASRRVITSSKVYPSEVNDVAERSRDIARFFFSTSYEDANSIIKKYDVRYIFLRRGSGTWMCRLINVCQWVTVSRHDRTRSFVSGALTPDGRQNTLIGRLFHGEAGPQFKKVWDSQRFLVYRVTAVTRPAECEFSSAEKKVIAGLARTSLGGDPAHDALVSNGSPIAGKRCAVALAAWHDGKLLSRSVSGQSTLAENIARAAEELRRNISEAIPLYSLRLELAIWQKSQEYPTDPQGFSEAYFDISHGYMLEKDGKRAYFFPSDVAVEPLRTSNDALFFLCRSLGQAENCWSGGKYELYAFPADIMMEPAPGSEVRGLLGLIPVSGDVREWREEDLVVRLRAALEWISVLGNEKKFIDAVSRDAVLGSLISLALAEGYAAIRDPRYLADARQGLDAVEHLVTDRRLPDTRALLSYSLLGRLSLWKSTGSSADLEKAKQLYDLLMALLDEKNAAFSSGLDVVDGELSPVTVYSAASYIVSTAGQPPDFLEDFAQLAYERFLVAKTTDRDVHFSDYAQLGNLFAILYRISPNADSARRVFSVSRWIAEYQYNDGPPGLRGAIPVSDEKGYIASDSVARSAETLAFALEVARDAGRDEVLHRAAVRSALQWLMIMQYYGKDSAYFVSDQTREKFTGGIRYDFGSREPSLSATVRFILAGTRYIQSEK